jgi:hypothetical protein
VNHVLISSPGERKAAYLASVERHSWVRCQMRTLLGECFGVTRQYGGYSA